ncbi:MAG: hypothetical protein IAE97_06010 [Chthoniobacterales bacterium]|nr:hypothetical protein [Chthoniobacterales bacterium]
MAISVLLAVVLAGGRPLWAQGIVTACIGALWVFWPPSKAPNRAVLGVLGLLAVVPLTVYLPATWTAPLAWREALANTTVMTLSPFVTPQPWLTLHNWLLWLTGVSLAGWCSAQAWDHYNRDTLARLITGGIVLIAAFAIYATSTGNNPDLWQSTNGFGPFANRNQWGSLLGLGAVMCVALIHQTLRRKRKRALVFWSASLAMLTWAIIQNGSRGGFVVLATGGFAYWTFFGLANKNYRYAAIALSFLLISFATISVSGGPMVERFIGLRETLTENADTDFRTQFYRMTLNLSADARLTGFGLGNFPYVFPFYLDFEPMMDRRPIHPESSWLWLLAEGGWLSVLTVFGAVSLLIYLAYTARKSRAATMRSAAMAVAVVMVVNAFFEVSGHRIGTLFPGIALAALALPPATAVIHPDVLRHILRLPGILLAVIGLIWTGTAAGWLMVPAIQGTYVIQEKAGSAHEKGDPGAAADFLAQAEKLEPLNWDFRWARATYLIEAGNPSAAWDEFRTAQAILPYMVWVLEREGYVWAPFNPSRAAYAWNQALRRAPPSRRAGMYASYLNAAKGNPLLKVALLNLYPDDPEIEFARLRAQQTGDPLPRLPRLLAITENLNLAPDHLIEPALRFLLNYSQVGLLDSLTESNPRLKRLGWRVLADRAANAERLDEALDLQFEYGPRPVLPAPISRSDLRTIERAAALAPLDIATAIAYYQALESARRKDDAFWQLRRIMESPEAPAYIWYLAAKAAHSRGDYPEAWQFLKTYEEKSKK